MKLKPAALAAATLAASAAHALFADVTLDSPHKTVVGGAQLVAYSGTISINETHFWNANVPHLYKDLSVNPADRIDMFNFTNGFYAWLSSGGATQAGGFYSGDIFLMEVDAGDEDGWYWHNFNGVNAPAEFYLRTSDGSFLDSNRVEYSLTIDSVPEPTSLTALALAGAGIFARRRRKS